ncbi:hypothetical protein DINM_006506 [Dirofilaria immitis]|nr:hypothetical protein [Dirofilaria immitis]
MAAMTNLKVIHSCENLESHSFLRKLGIRPYIFIKISKECLLILEQVLKGEDNFGVILLDSSDFEKFSEKDTSVECGNFGFHECCFRATSCIFHLIPHLHTFVYFAKLMLSQVPRNTICPIIIIQFKDGGLDGEPSIFFMILGFFDILFLSATVIRVMRHYQICGMGRRQYDMNAPYPVTAYVYPLEKRTSAVVVDILVGSTTLVISGRLNHRVNFSLV